MSSKVEDELQRLENDVRHLKGLHDVDRNQDLERQMKEIVYDVQDIRESWLINRAAAAANSNIWRRYLTVDLVKMSVYKIARKISSTRAGRVDPLIRFRRIDDLQDVQEFPKKANQVPLVQLNKQVAQVREEMSVGFEDEEESLINCLMQETEELDVISITGMPGIGKTTLARKIYHSERIRTQFPTRIWVDMPHEFCSKDLYLNILKEFNEQDMVDYDEFERLLDMPCSKVSYLDILNECIKSGRINDHEFHACLKKSRFLLVMDAVWTADALESVRFFLPKTGKVLITSRDNRVTRKPHVLRFLNERESWELLQLEVFGKLDECPESLKPLGERIAKKCDGSPLAIVIVASGLVIPSPVPVDDPAVDLTAVDLTKQWWKKVSEHATKYITEYGAQRDLFKHVELSYIKLPQYLQDCFLYLGVFPDDDEISVWTLIHLWVAEGLVQDSWGLTLEETAERNLYDLISRNLVVVGKIYPNGHIKTCRLHPLMYGFCKYKAAEQEFYHELRTSEQGDVDHLITLAPNHRRLCINSSLKRFLLKGPSIRSLLCLNKEGEDLDPKDSSTILQSFKLLKIFACKGVKFTEFPTMLSKLMNLRYICLSCDNLDVIPESISSLYYLETLVVDTRSDSTIQFKANIWRMLRLQHLVIKAAIVLAIQGEGEAGEDLHMLTRLAPESCTEEMFTRTPNLKTLGIQGNLASLPSAESLKKLECLQHLKLINKPAADIQLDLDHLDCFPPTLKRLTLSGTYLKWGCMSILGNIDGLEILKLKNSAFTGESWRSADAGGFCSLRFLLIGNTDLESWEASPGCFPNLKCLVLKNCEKLNRIPSTLAKSLDKVDVDKVSDSAAASAKEIEREIATRQRGKDTKQSE